MSKLWVAKMLNSRYHDEVTDKHPRLKRYCIAQKWLQGGDKVLSDYYGLYIRDNYLV